MRGPIGALFSIRPAGISDAPTKELQERAIRIAAQGQARNYGLAGTPAAPEETELFNALSSDCTVAHAFASRFEAYGASGSE